MYMYIYIYIYIIYICMFIHALLFTFGEAFRMVYVIACFCLVRVIVFITGSRPMDSGGIEGVAEILGHPEAYKVGVSHFVSICIGESDSLYLYHYTN